MPLLQLNSAVMCVCCCACLQLAVLASAGWGVGNGFGLTDITSQLYGNCQGSSCSFDISQIATAIGQSVSAAEVSV